MTLLDVMRRPLRDLRVSVTDRCNFRCVYCMPKEIFGRDFEFLSRAELLTFEEITRMVRLFTSIGVEKVRLTGGEPLLRHEIAKLIAMLASIEPLRDLALTTNGSLLTRETARELKAAGLHRVTISLDSLDDAVFRAMNDVDFPVSRVLTAIEAAVEAGLAPVKVDVVVKRGVNDAGIVGLARHFRGTGVVVRFIEYMDVGNSNGWRLDDVVPGHQIIETLSREWPLSPVPGSYFGEVAQRWAYTDGSGEIGVISSVTRPFCADCTRARITADGQMYLCLFATKGHDVRALLRSDASDSEIVSGLTSIWMQRSDRYSEIRADATPSLPRVEMSHIGG